MSIRRKINRVVGPLTGYEISKVEFGRDLWRDVRSILGDVGHANVFDVGANEGQSARQFLEWFPEARVYCFEPGPAAYQKLCKLAAGEERLVPSEIALSDTPGHAEFFINQFDQTSSMLPTSQTAKELLGKALHLDRTIQVKTETLDGFCQQHSLDSMCLLKLDVQGHELNVLRGAQRMLSEGRIRCVTAEVNFEDIYEGQSSFSEMEALLRGTGYHFVAFYNHAWGRSRELLWCEALFVGGRTD